MARFFLVSGIFLLVFTFPVLKSSAQVTIAADGLNNSSSLFTLTNGAFYSGNSSDNDTPANSSFAIEGSYSWGVSNGTAMLTSSNINTTGYTNISLSLRLASIAINDNTGFENVDYVRIDVSTDGGTNYETCLTVTGNNSSNWPFSATGVAITTFGSPATFAPNSGGTRTTDGYSTLIISGLPSVSNLRIRISMQNSTTAERWLVDDFKITGTTCSSITSFPYFQNFDSWSVSSPTAACTSNGSVPLFDCWNNAVNDNFDWDIFSGSTSTGGTGPSGDHTGGGNYLYTESSGGCSNQTGSITTPTFDFSTLSSPELSFWYHMFGNDIGTLSVQVSTDMGSSWSSNLWSLSGNQKSNWKNAVVDLSAFQGQSHIIIRFSGTTGSGDKSDMAIDDISVSGVVCNIPDVPTITATQTTICEGSSATLSISSGSLNDADHWQWYSGSCGGTAVGQGTTITVIPTTTTTYYIRGEGSSCDRSTCASITVTVDPSVPDYNAAIKNASCPAGLDGEIEITLPVPVQFNDPDYIDISSTLFSNRSEFTLEGWIKVDLANVGSRISLFGQNDAIEFGFSNASTLDCWSASGGSVSTNSYPSDNDWHHVAAVGNGTNIVLYIDGTPVATGGYSTSNYGNDANYSTKIGAGVWDPTGGYFPGSMLKVGFWSVALNPTEISNLASGYYDYIGSETGLLAGYNFNEGAGTTLNSVKTGSNGTFSGTPTWNNPYTYSWTKTGDGSFSSSAKNLTNLSTGEYNVTVTFNGCTRDKSFTVISNYDSPEISTLSTPASLCDGGSFNPTTPSINDNGSPLTEQGWEIETSFGSGSFISLSVPYIVNVNDNGKKIRYFASNSCGSSISNEVVLMVVSDPVATISSSNGPICSGSDVEFSLVGTSGATVTYNINGGPDLNITLDGGTADIIVNSPATNQTLNLTAIDDGTCQQSLTESTTVIINPYPATGEIIPD